MRHKLVVITIILALSMSGCSTGAKNYKSMKTEPMLTTQEVLDYYAEELSYRPITQYNVLDSTVLEFNDVNGDMKEKAISTYRKVIAEYKKSDKYSITEGQHDYLKYFIDNMAINESGINGVKEAMGYYYVEVSYDTSSNNIGEFKGEANYLGIDGIIVENYNKETVIDNNYLESAIKTMNKYRKSAGEPLLTKTGTDENEYGRDKHVSNGTGAVGTISSTDNVRKLTYDINEFNKVVGSSKAQIAFMPNISFVYEPTTTRGTVNGYGLFDAGNYGLKDFGYSKVNDSGELVVTYVFKQDELDKNVLTYQLCYINSYKSNNVLDKYIETANNENGDTQETISKITVPDFVNNELSKVVERLDRAVCNRDIAALMSADIVEDAGLGILYGMYGRNSQIVSFVSNINGVLDRENNVYLVELERTIEDAAKGTDTTAIYKDTYYMVIRQNDLLFKINDIVMTSRELVRAPEPNPDDASYRRLVALNLSGPISQANKDSITNSLNMLYTASTNRELTGMYSRFNANKELLTPERLEYLNSRLRGYLTAKGTSQEAIMSGNVMSWIGGYDTQAELTTEELIEYTGLDQATHLKCYYLMSNYGTEWLIDDIEVISQEEVSGEQLAEIKAKLIE